MAIKAVIWDLGGVIRRTVDEAPRLAIDEKLRVQFQDMLQIIFDSEESHQAQLGKILAQVFWERAGKKLGLSYEEFKEEFYRGDMIDYELVESIRALRPRYKMGLLSNAFSDLRQWLIQRGIADAFDHLVISAEVNLMKPDPAIYSMATTHLGVVPNEAIFIDDLAVNVEAAKEAGMQGIQFFSREQTLSELQKILESSPLLRVSEGK